MFTHTFTDAYNISHTDALFQIRAADEIETTNNNLRVDRTSNALVAGTNSTKNYTYSMEYWKSAADKDAGFKALEFTTVDYQTNFGFQHDAAYDGLTLEQICEKHFKEVVLGLPAA